jgi:hypothetical protein
VSEQTPTGGANFQLVPSPETEGVPVIYANFFQGTVSPHDLTMHLGWFAIPALLDPPTETVQVPVRPLMKVSLPLSIVPGVIEVLQSQLQTWRDTFGSQPQEAQEARE